MDLRIDMSKEYGVVLEGGGAKGAYQIGVLRALKELDVNIKAVVGTSVGALNGVLVAQDNLDKAVELWQNIRYSQVINVEDDILERITKLDFKDLDFKKIFNKIIQVIIDRGVDVTPLKKMIAEVVDEEKVRNSDIEFGLVTISLSDRKPLELFIEDIEEGRLNDFLLASSYLPVFKNEKLHGTRYLDGGFYNNSPMSMLVDRGYKNLIVIKIKGIGFDKKSNLEDVNVFEIAPSENLGGILEFDTNKANYNLNLGYYDAIRRIKGLRGRHYYIDTDKEEEYFISTLIQMDSKNKAKYCRTNNLRNKSLNRAILEDVIPRLAKKLGIREKWDYCDFIIELLEYFGKKLKVERFRIYTFEQFFTLIRNRLRRTRFEMEEDERMFKNLIEELALIS
ncbi:patatin-like phospholipase family protein [Vallitalea maricola]|uniref:Patatin-like phospholipase family protein n=1 Tax=Vallitalea maricola TaxID=3074433 RepID=A0ACB5UJT0_9FIRM|nr:patatin-like phospholipase family protein [Vallitalea sp. AN17-2]